MALRYAPSQVICWSGASGVRGIRRPFRTAICASCSMMRRSAVVIRISLSFDGALATCGCSLALVLCEELVHFSAMVPAAIMGTHTRWCARHFWLTLLRLCHQCLWFALLPWRSPRGRLTLVPCCIPVRWFTISVLLVLLPPPDTAWSVVLALTMGRSCSMVLSDTVAAQAKWCSSVWWLARPLWRCLSLWLLLMVGALVRAGSRVSSGALERYGSLPYLGTLDWTGSLGRWCPRIMWLLPKCGAHAFYGSTPGMVLAR